MNRRSFLKAMGITGALSLTNWKTLIRGPVSGDKIYRFRADSSIFVVAGEALRAGTLVYIGADKKAYAMRDVNNCVGALMEDSKKGCGAEVMTRGVVWLPVGKGPAEYDALPLLRNSYKKEGR